MSKIVPRDCANDKLPRISPSVKALRLCHLPHQSEVLVRRIFKNKKQAALRVMDIALSIKDNYALHMDYLAIMAQNSVIAGDWSRAISYYFELLNEDGVLNADYDESYYAGELELAAKIVHNICVLYFIGLKSDEFTHIKKKYDYIFKLESQRTKRLVRNNPAFKEGFEEDFNTLCSLQAFSITITRMLWVSPPAV